MIIFSRHVGEAVMVGDRVEVAVAAIEPMFAVLSIRHSPAGGLVSAEDSLRLTCAIGDVVQVPAAGSCTVVEIRDDVGKVRLGMDAPKDISIHRKEVWEAIKRENRSERGLQ
jgi:carbon storage regulator CsrA